MDHVSPCPFCGFEECHTTSGWDMYGWAVYCPSCKATGPERPGEKAAIAAFNGYLETRNPADDGDEGEGRAA